MKGRLLRFSAIVLILSLFYGCGQEYMYTRPGPPPHAKAYGQKKKVYRYYPELKVYCDTASGIYMVFRDNHWVRQHALPQVSAASYQYVTIETDNPEPWREHTRYGNSYTPGKKKRK